jgi:hypothetical protein
VRIAQDAARKTESYSRFHTQTCAGSFAKNRNESEQEATETTEAQEVGVETSRFRDSPGR